MATSTTDMIGRERWISTATFPEEPSSAAAMAKVDALLEFGMDARETVHLFGDHGVGKTSRVLAFFARLGIKVNYINLANTSPDDKLVVAPVKGADGKLSLRQLLMEDLTPGEPFAIILDDALQASRQVQNQFMQLTNNWTIGQQDMPDLVGVVMLDNEGAAEGIRHSEDPAVADRKVTLRLNANDTGWRYALARKYKDTDLNGVFETWDGLNNELRHILSPRALDHLIFVALHGLAPIYALPIVGGRRVRLETVSSDGRVNDRTEEILRSVCSSLGVAYTEKTPDSVRKTIRLALEHRLAVMIEGPPGIGKTEIVKAEIAQAELRSVYYSMPFTDPEALTAPMPHDGGLVALIAEELLNPDPYVITWDEYNRPTSQAAFAKLMEVTQQWTLAGIDLPGCRAQIALCNPPEWLGRRMQVSKGNIAQADRFTISLQIGEDDIPANEWLLTMWPDTVSKGDPETRERARSVIESVLEWFKNDIGAEHRQWITKRTLVRLAKLHMRGLPLEMGKIYLGEGEYAPVPLHELEARLADRPMTRLQEIVTNLDSWLTKLRAAGEASGVGTNDVDVVHQALSNAELSQIAASGDAVAKLVAELPPKLRITFLAGADTETQRVWTDIMKQVLAIRTAALNAA